MSPTCSLVLGQSRIDINKSWLFMPPMSWVSHALAHSDQCTHDPSAIKNKSGSLLRLFVVCVVVAFLCCLLLLVLFSLFYFCCAIVMLWCCCWCGLLLRVFVRRFCCLAVIGVLSSFCAALFRCCCMLLLFCCCCPFVLIGVSLLSFRHCRGSIIVIVVSLLLLLFCCRVTKDFFSAGSIISAWMKFSMGRTEQAFHFVVVLLLGRTEDPFHFVVVLLWRFFCSVAVIEAQEEGELSSGMIWLLSLWWCYLSALLVVLALSHRSTVAVCSVVAVCHNGTSLLAPFTQSELT